jgi:hypothetical protein
MPGQSGFVDEIRFEMNGHTVVAWMTGSVGSTGEQRVGHRPPHWMIEVDGGRAFVGPAYHPYDLGQELLAKAILRDFLRHDVRLAPKKEP